MSTVNIPVYERQFAVVLPEELRAYYFRGEVPSALQRQFEEWKAQAFVDGAPPPSMTESNVAKFFLRTVALADGDALGDVSLAALFPMSNASITALDAAAVRRAAVAGHTSLTRMVVDSAIAPLEVVPVDGRGRHKASSAVSGAGVDAASAAAIDRNLLDFFRMRGNAKYRKDLMINITLEEAHCAKGLADRVARRMAVLGEFEQGLLRRLLCGEAPSDVMKDARSRSLPPA
ncbi:hypothetical protein [Chromobacterium sp. IIBBL 290-4]|uniref:hypothetical protein n=1 Tax=Chromobacterium sp. IIBBL 290-4 TaxID=2953890 RepID=UPI0020B68443|nr:hypothetical protein [Chromobacterium sp. IIBBL 290-4]UTH74126.1 hypothetical protein NKT35_21700 [Chromobacterium sp. IIBBL 290-4]